MQQLISICLTCTSLAFAFNLIVCYLHTLCIGFFIALFTFIAQRSAYKCRFAQTVHNCVLMLRPQIGLVVSVCILCIDESTIHLYTFEEEIDFFFCRVNYPIQSIHHLIVTLNELPVNTSNKWIHEDDKAKQLKTIS